MPPGHIGASPRPAQPRPPVRPGAGTNDATDPSKWLAATMSMLPAEQQGRLADLFRGLQSKAIDFPSFMRDAEVIMGSKFQDMLALMRNQGPRSAQQQQQQQQQRVSKPVRPQASSGVAQHPSPLPMHRAGASVATPAVRPGLQHAPPTSSPLVVPSSGLPHAPLASNPSHNGLPTQGMLVGQLADSGRSYALARQLLAQHAGAQVDAGRGLPTVAGNSGGTVAGVPVGIGGTPFEADFSRWRQIILNPAIPGEQLARLSMQLSAYGENLATPPGPVPGISEEERNQQFSQISKLQALIAQRQFARGPVPSSQQAESRPESPLAEGKGKDTKRRGTPSRTMKDSGSAKAKKRPGEALQQSSPVPRTATKKPRTTGDWGAEHDTGLLSAKQGFAGSSLGLESMPVGPAGGGSYMDEYDPMDTLHPRRAVSRASTVGTGGHASDDGGDDDEQDRIRADARDRSIDGPREKAALREIQRRAKEKRDRERPGPTAASGGNSMYDINDVMGYAGINLREESEMILGSSMHHHESHGLVGDEGPAHFTHHVGDIEIARDRALRANFANAAAVEALVAKVCQGSHIRAVAADVVPYLSFALQERLRSFMELVSAAAYHRTRTQTLPPPPLDPNTRLPLYKITPHLDVKKQLLVIERVDQLREQARKQRLAEREQRNEPDRPQSHGGDGDGDGENPRAAAPEATGSAPAGSSAESAVMAARGGDAARQQGGLLPHAVGGDAGDQSRGAAAASAKRARKKDDDSPAYTSKNMPEELQNKISNMTALRAVGGVRKAWMSSSSPSWLRGASAGKSSASDATAPRLAATPDAADAVPRASVASPTTHGGMSPMHPAGSGMEPGAEPGSAAAAHGHERSHSGLGAMDDADGGPSTPFTPLRAQAPLLAHRPVTLAAPLLVTVRD
ncbi:hypothetical protein LPJ61_003571, partial [Coemansia biformis]